MAIWKLTLCQRIEKFFGNYSYLHHSTCHAAKRTRWRTLLRGTLVSSRNDLSFNFPIFQTGAPRACRPRETRPPRYRRAPSATAQRSAPYPIYSEETCYRWNTTSAGAHGDGRRNTQSGVKRLSTRFYRTLRQPASVVKEKQKKPLSLAFSLAKKPKYYTAREEQLSGYLFKGHSCPWPEASVLFLLDWEFYIPWRRNLALLLRFHVGCLDVPELNRKPLSGQYYLSTGPASLCCV